MLKTMKHMLAWLCVAAVCCLMIPAWTALAATSGDFQYTITKNEAAITGYVGSSPDVVIPEVLNGYPVKTISNRAFFKMTSIESVTIPACVTSINADAFQGCSSLKAVYICDLAVWVNMQFAAADDNPLYYAQNLYLNGELVTDLTIPDGITSINAYTFVNCTSISNLTIPQGVTSIGNSAFEKCTSMTKLSVPATVTNIGANAFYGCASLTDIYYGGTPQQWNTIITANGGNDCLTNAIFVNTEMNATAHYFDYEILEDGTISITGYTPDVDDMGNLLLIPSQIGGYTVSAISNAAFLRMHAMNIDCIIDTVVIPGTVKTIGIGAFQETAIKRVFIQEGVEEICDQAFFNCKSLETLVIPSSVKTIGYHAIGFAWYTDPAYPNVVPGIPGIVPGFVMYADGNEAASAYAADTGVSFEELSDVPVGDIDFDGTVATKDVRTMLRYMMVTDVMYCLNDWRNADVNNDGEFNTTDARDLLDRLMTTEENGDRLLAFETPKNSNLTSEEIQSNCVGEVIQSYDAFEAACAKICYAFYTPYESADGSFDAWKQTITPAYFETKSLLIVSRGTHAQDFELDYAVTDDTVNITVMESDYISFGALEVWQLVVEIDNADLIGREVIFDIVMEW